MLKLFQQLGRIKEKGRGVNSSMIYLIYCKNLCKYHNVPLPSTTILKKQPTDSVHSPIISRTIFTELEKKSKTHMKARKIPDSQSNPEPKE
jgi:hypothetical protein